MDYMPSKRIKLNKDRNKVDSEYFSNYDHLSIHEEMLKDRIRTEIYEKALQIHAKDKIILDIGCGTGILSLFAARHGAKKVYAIEAAQKLGNLVQKVVKANGYDHIIDVYIGKVEDIDFPSKVDIIVSEWMGYFLLYESMFQSVIYARDKWLKKDGILLPHEAKLYISLLSYPLYFQDHIDFWQSQYNFNFEPLMALANQLIINEPLSEVLEPEHEVSNPQCILSIDCYSVTIDQLSSWSGFFSLSSYGYNQINGFISWFEVFFSGSSLSKISSPTSSLILSTSPCHQPTHWGQTIFFTSLYDLNPNEIVHGEIKININQNNFRCLDVSISYKIREQVFLQKYLLE